MNYDHLSPEASLELLAEKDRFIKTLQNELNRTALYHGNYLRHVFGHMPEAVMEMDAQLKVIWANHQALEHWPNAVGEYCYDVMGGLKEERKCPCFRALELQVTIREQVAFKDQSGREMTVDCSIIPVFADTGDVAGLIGICKDITEVETTKRKIDAYDEELSSARDLANEAKTAKLHFLANTSHEIRTPMNGILGMIQLLEHSNLDGRQEELVNYLRAASDRLLKVLDGILAMSNLEQDELQLIEEEFNFSDFVKTIVGSKEKAAISKGLTLDSRISSQVPDAIIVDKYRLNQIISNILDNSIKFSRIGNVEVVADSEYSEDDKLVLIIKISDTGIGIPEDKLESIFETFNQVDNSSTREFGGTGLGLSIAKRLIDLMRGSISVQSHYGVGTTFTVRIPVNISEFETRKLRNAKSSTQAIVSEEKEQEKKIYRILVAEDEVLGRITLKFMLKDRYEVIFAKNGKQAVDLYFEKEPDLVLMDIMMPVMNGFEAFDEIEKNSSGKRVPIIACTAKVIKTEKEYLMSYGFDDYISKPIDMRHLHQIIDRLLIKGR